MGKRTSNSRNWKNNRIEYNFWCHNWLFIKIVRNRWLIYKNENAGKTVTNNINSRAKT